MKRIFFKHFWAIIILVLLAFMACSEEEGNIPLEQNSTPPGAVMNITVTNLAGKAQLTYNLPSDKDLLYVVARYTLENGREMEVKASYYNNKMLLEGFAGGSDIEVEVRAVNRSETESQPVKVTVSPLPAPIFAIFDSLETAADFGGISVQASNPTSEDIALLVMRKNKRGDWEPMPQSIYTKSDIISRSIRDASFDTIPIEFAFTVRDRWLNTTDTLLTTITPLYEQLMPKTNYVGRELASDAPHPGYPISNLWDGETLDWTGSYFTDRFVGIGPHMVTFDISQTTKISRLHIWNFSEPIIPERRFYYYLGAMRYFEIWGSNELIDSSWDEMTDPSYTGPWVRMGEYEVIKPSGLPEGTETAADTAAAEDGEDWLVNFDKPAVRYLRLVCKENWRGLDYMSVAELEVFGNPNF